VNIVTSDPNVPTGVLVAKEQVIVSCSNGWCKYIV